ncbi:MAG: PAS domain-containing sensor histidine kinase [Desulfobacterota bacterium]|nr:PAS domain-containing sensor histidine kinase [Thermodesulfobacteriota bacterium]MDW8002340.1 PAS domain-containing sensor histidine kinase [Deltaproteobacteria bacterium]
MESLRVSDWKNWKEKKCFEVLFRRDLKCDFCPLCESEDLGSVRTSVVEDRASGKYLKISVFPLDYEGDKNGLLYVEMIQDVTEQKKAEEELKKLSDFNAAIIKNAPVAIFTIDKTGKFMSVNPALAAISGLGDEAEKKLLKFNWLQNKYTIECGLADYIKRGLEGEPFELHDFPFTNYKGTRGQFLHFRGVPIRDKDGNVECLLCIIEETTEKVMAKLQSIQDAKMSVIGRLMTAVAHELNNPLATICANSELACELFEEMKKRRNKEMDEIYECLEVIQKEAFRCKRIIRDMLNLTKKESFEFKEIDVGICIKEVLADYRQKQPNVEIRVRLERKLPPILGDFNALKQCLSNLIQNAFDAVETKEKGIIKIQAHRDDGHVVVEIEDNGVGIHEALLDRIFEPFFSTKNDGRGIGLGLTLCHEFVKRMGGRVEVRSTLGKGSCFKVIFPAAKKD